MPLEGAELEAAFAALSAALDRRPDARELLLAKLALLLAHEIGSLERLQTLIAIAERDLPPAPSNVI